MTGTAVSMKIDCVGHVALNVRDLSRSEAFYAGVLGLPVSGRMGDDMVFFRLSPDRYRRRRRSPTTASPHVTSQ
jgi:catechol 2,3-dioxygenase-like lactoylglutathione lyase family enzyme